MTHLYPFWGTFCLEKKTCTAWEKQSLRHPLHNQQDSNSRLCPIFQSNNVPFGKNKQTAHTGACLVHTYLLFGLVTTSVPSRYASGMISGDAIMAVYHWISFENIYRNLQKKKAWLNWLLNNVFISYRIIHETCHWILHSAGFDGLVEWTSETTMVSIITTLSRQGINPALNVPDRCCDKSDTLNTSTIWWSPIASLASCCNQLLDQHETSW